MATSIVPAFKRKMNTEKRKLKAFLTRLDKYKVPELKQWSKEAEVEAWKDTACLQCSNCCRGMTPTFTTNDIARISAHFKLTPDEFKQKWLHKEKSTGDWVNVKQPCQFLDLDTHMCSIYDIRPIDCATFPHFDKKPNEYGHVFKQNLEYCPATLKWVEAIKEKVEAKYNII
jgi:uncharacterized protein